MKKGIIYSRVSTVSQDTDRQNNELKEYAKRNDIEVIRVFTDVSSGKVKAKDRTGAKDMFNFLEVEKIDIVLVSEISRLGRSAIDVQTNISKIVEEHDIDLYIYQQSLKAKNKDGKSNMAFKLVTDVLANVAQMEREQISERVKSGLIEARRKGKTLGRPQGSTKGTKDILQEYKQVVKELRNGMSIRKVAKLCDVSPATVQKVKKAMAA